MKPRRQNIEDKAYVALDQVPLTGTVQFYVSRNPRKRYSGDLTNDSFSSTIMLQIESHGGYFSQAKTLQPGDRFEFQVFPLSGITLTGTNAVYSLVAWATKDPNGFVRYIPKAAKNINAPSGYDALSASYTNTTLNTFSVGEGITMTAPFTATRPGTVVIWGVARGSNNTAGDSCAITLYRSPTGIPAQGAAPGGLDVALRAISILSPLANAAYDASFVLVDTVNFTPIYYYYAIAAITGGQAMIYGGANRTTLMTSLTS